MGIKNLNKVIKEHAPKAIKSIKYKSLENKVLAVDTSIILYQYLVAIKDNVEELQTKEGRVTSHIHGILTRTLNFIKKKIKLIYVFDGKPPDIKSATLDSRRLIKDASILKLNGYATMLSAGLLFLGKRFTLNSTLQKKKSC